MIFTTIVHGVYKPSYNWGSPNCMRVCFLGWGWGGETFFLVTKDTHLEVEPVSSQKLIDFEDFIPAMDFWPGPLENWRTPLISLQDFWVPNYPM